MLSTMMEERRTEGTVPILHYPLKMMIFLHRDSQQNLNYRRGRSRVLHIKSYSKLLLISVPKTVFNPNTCSYK